MTTVSRKPIIGFLALSILLLAATCREPKQAAPLNLFDLQTRQSINGFHPLLRSPVGLGHGHGHQQSQPPGAAP
ncbi:MAG: hypothetical protein V2I40_12035 [Desulfobacteraceae bacterium]|jgi:hypothetical protein|nr:hypothetical protein [Desulfobacteraceae bacterium]